jgi:tetrapyrrole methylase family protein/MazG family protein
MIESVLFLSMINHLGKVSMNNESVSLAFSRLYNLLKELRSPSGCPWDKAQTPQTLMSHLTEEMYEVLAAIQEDNTKALKEELGDLLLVTTMIAMIYEEQQIFSMTNVLNDLSDKLVRRHPHVFGQDKAHNVEESLNSWQRVKSAEIIAGKPAERGGSLARIGRSLPPLERSFAIQKKAAKMGFGWDTMAQVWNKLNEEQAELRVEIDLDDQLAIKDELGDVLFVTSCLALQLNMDPAEALAGANSKFLRRFEQVEQAMQNQNLLCCQENRVAMEIAWQRAKQQEKQK